MNCGLEFRVSEVWLRVYGLGVMVEVLRFAGFRGNDYGVKFRVYGYGFKFRV